MLQAPNLRSEDYRLQLPSSLQNGTNDFSTGLRAAQTIATEASIATAFLVPELLAAEPLPLFQETRGGPLGLAWLLN